MKRKLVRGIIALGVTAVLPAWGTAQALRYAYRPGDTVRFVETIHVSGTNTGRGGRQTIGITRESKIAFAFLPGDSAKAWYDELTMEATGPSGSRHAETRAVVRVPFVLRVYPDGNVKTMLTPTLPDIVRQLDEFYPQFDDFLAMLPADSLTVGATRTDTLLRRESLGNRRIVIRRVVHSRVERDTVVSAQPAVVLGIRATLHIEVSAGATTGQFSTSMVLSGTEAGTAIVTKAGEMLQRSRTGEARGATTYTGRGAQVTVPQTYSYRATITAAGR